MNTKITRSQFSQSIKVQSNVFSCQASIQSLQHHLEFLTRSGDLDKLVEFAKSLYAYSTSILHNYLDTLSDDEK